MTTVGRNDLCPCGSGKKYEHCCLGKREVATTELGRLAHARHDIERPAFERVVGWAIRRFGPDWADPAVLELKTDAPPTEDAFAILLPWLVYHRPLEQASPVAQFLAEAGAGGGGRQAAEGLNPTCLSRSP